MTVTMRSIAMLGVTVISTPRCERLGLFIVGMRIRCPAMHEGHSRCAKKVNTRACNGWSYYANHHQWLCRDIVLCNVQSIFNPDTLQILEEFDAE
jgi:hypothetical protein